MVDPMGDKEAAAELSVAYKQILSEVKKQIVGQENVIELLLTALFAQGHCLLVGVPGLAKTLLVSTLAASLDLQFKRIQFTPDLMPADITGTEVLEEDPSTGHRIFRFIKGPVFANLVLADEINRTPPKTQAALLEAMQERSVTTGGKTFNLDLPFVVLATQNPIEQEGTYPLPEAQLDRFMLQINVQYPSESDEQEIVKQQTCDYEPSINAVLSPEKITALQSLVLRVPAAEHVIQYAVALARGTRPGSSALPFINEFLSWGAGPRATQHLVLAGKARALLQGRYAVTVDDINALAAPVLQHRLITNYRADAAGISSEDIIDKLLASTQGA